VSLHLNLPDRIHDAKVARFHSPTPPALSVVPMNYRKAMGETILFDLADRIGRVNQALDPHAPDPPLTSGQLGAIDPQFQVRLNDAARCAVRWPDPHQHADALLRLRQALAPKLFDAEYPMLDEEAITVVNEAAEVALAILQLHFTGAMSPLHTAERDELSGSNQSGDAA
jgi:hypothetical protein